MTPREPQLHTAWVWGLGFRAQILFLAFPNWGPLSYVPRHTAILIPGTAKRGSTPGCQAVNTNLAALSPKPDSWFVGNRGISYIGVIYLYSKFQSLSSGLG